MYTRVLGRTGLLVTRLGYGAFKLGRNLGAKYPAAYDLPDEATAARILHGVLDLGIRLLDTAPAYGLSEERIGRALADRRSEFVLCTKAGEEFVDGRSHFDFSPEAIQASAERSLRRLRTDALDVLLLHAGEGDLSLAQADDVVAALQRLRGQGRTRAIGFSAKSLPAALAALAWADVLMLTYHAEDESLAGAIDAAAAQGVGVLVKKGLASGRLPAAQAIRFVLGNCGVDALVVGGLSLDHLAANVAAADAA